MNITLEGEVASRQPDSIPKRETRNEKRLRNAAIAFSYRHLCCSVPSPVGFIAPCLPPKLINCRWFSSGGPQGQRRIEYAYAPHSRCGGFPEEARHPSARNLSGR